MRCNNSELIASAHLDQRLNRNETREYLAHIEICAGCRTNLAELEQVSLMLKTVRMPYVSRELRSHVMAAIANK